MCALVTWYFFKTDPLIFFSEVQCGSRQKNFFFSLFLVHYYDAKEQFPLWTETLESFWFLTCIVVLVHLRVYICRGECFATAFQKVIGSQHEHSASNCIWFLVNLALRCFWKSKNFVSPDSRLGVSLWLWKCVSTFSASVVVSLTYTRFIRMCAASPHRNVLLPGWSCQRWYA